LNGHVHAKGTYENAKGYQQRLRFALAYSGLFSPLIDRLAREYRMMGQMCTINDQ